MQEEKKKEFSEKKIKIKIKRIISIHLLISGTY